MTEFANFDPIPWIIIAHGPRPKNATNMAPNKIYVVTLFERPLLKFKWISDLKFWLLKDVQLHLTKIKPC